MFYGEFHHHIDRKGRIILPSKFREVSAENNIEKFFVTRGLDRCLFMFSEYEWSSQEQKFRNLSFTKQESRSFNRMFFSGAVDVTPDKQGRFIIPQYLKDFAHVKKDVTIIGISNRIEIWNSSSWKDFYANSKETFEQISENMLNL